MLMLRYTFYGNPKFGSDDVTKNGGTNYRTSTSNVCKKQV